jgi:hypothetical protein
MQVMVLVKANERGEAGEAPSTEELTAMGQFNEDLVKAGVMLSGGGLRPSSYGQRVRFGAAGTGSTVLDGPFAETKELIGGFWIWEVASMEEAVAWLQRAPFESEDVEIRPFHEPEDFGDNLTPELRTAEDRLREEAAARK